MLSPGHTRAGRTRRDVFSIRLESHKPPHDPPHLHRHRELGRLAEDPCSLCLRSYDCTVYENSRRRSSARWGAKLRTRSSAFWRSASRLWLVCSTIPSIWSRSACCFSTCPASVHAHQSRPGRPDTRVRPAHVEGERVRKREGDTAWGRVWARVGACGRVWAMVSGHLLALVNLLGQLCAYHVQLHAGRFETLRGGALLTAQVLEHGTRRLATLLVRSLLSTSVCEQHSRGELPLAHRLARGRVATPCEEHRWESMGGMHGRGACSGHPTRPAHACRGESAGLGTDC
jgi:hypothetical protein